MKCAITLEKSSDRFHTCCFLVVHLWFTGAAQRLRDVVVIVESGTPAESVADEDEVESLDYTPTIVRAAGRNRVTLRTLVFSV